MNITLSVCGSTNEEVTEKCFQNLQIHVKWKIKLFLIFWFTKILISPGIYFISIRLFKKNFQGLLIQRMSLSQHILLTEWWMEVNRLTLSVDSVFLSSPMKSISLTYFQSIIKEAVFVTTISEKLCSEIKSNSWKRGYFIDISLLMGSKMSLLFSFVCLFWFFLCCWTFGSFDLLFPL